MDMEMDMDMGSREERVCGVWWGGGVLLWSEELGGGRKKVDRERVGRGRGEG